MNHAPPSQDAPDDDSSTGGHAHRTVVLLSGGLDSATVAAWAVHQGHRVTALSVDYGQRHAVELAAAKRVAAALGISDHLVIRVDLAACGGSALVDPAIAVPKDRPADEIAAGIPVTYVPARNTVFLALALAVAETRGATAIALGINSIDYSGYPDCRPEYIAAFARMAALATKAGVEGGPVEILAPLVRMSKAEIVRLGLDLGLDQSLTTSCYDPDDAGRPCRRCDACQLREAGFATAGVVDPLVAGRAG